MALPEGLIIQVVGYGIVILLVLFVLSFMFRGFFWKFLRVKASMGRLVLIKLRSINIDHFIIGSIKEGALVFKHNKGEKIIAIKDSSVFYKSIGIIWVDIDESTFNLVKPDFSVVEGFDPEKMNNLFLRALSKPSITNNFEKVMLVLVLIGAIAGVVGLVMIMKQQGMITSLQGQVIALGTQIKGQVVQSSVI